jgi:hypothetical protein
MQEIYTAAEGRRESRRSPPADYQYVMIIDMATLSAILPSRTDGGRVRYESAKLPRRVNKAELSLMWGKFFSDECYNCSLRLASGGQTCRSSMVRLDPAVCAGGHPLIC